MNSLREMDRSRVAWWLVAAMLGLALVYVIYSFIGTFVFGIFLYYATRPVYRRIRATIGQRDLAAAISLVTLALPAILLFAYAIAIGLQELDKLAEFDRLTQIQATLGPYINASSIATDPQTLLTERTVGTARELFNQTFQYIGLLGTGAIHLFVMLALSFYLLRDDRKLSAWFRARFGSDDGVLDAYLDAVDEDFHNIFFGNILNAVLTGSIGAIMYNVLDLIAPTGLGIPSPSLVGLFTGAASLIPIVGMKLVYFPVTMYLIGQAIVADPTLASLSSVIWFPGVFFLVSLVLVDTIPDLVLRPYVSGRNLHVGMIMLAYILGPLLFGWYGIFLGPMILVLLVHFVEIILPELLAGDPIRPWAVEETEAGEEVSGDSEDQAPVDPAEIPDDGPDGITVDDDENEAGDPERDTRRTTDRDGYDAD